MAMPQWLCVGKKLVPIKNGDFPMKNGDFP
jgi:hypothetical protein